MTEFRSYKWITADSTQAGRAIQVNNVTQAFGPVAKNHCNLISIFGRARQGKSFLMNCLAGEKDIFRISNEKESCTQGIDISNKWLPLNDFSRIDTGKSTVSSIPDLKVGFVDAEGQGDKDVSYDANLICPILLASKCVIFNWKGDLQKDHILSTLGIMTRAARNVATDSMESASAGKAKKFGHLHIIFRDWQSVGSDEASTFNALFGIENTAEGGTRDQIRSDVMESFESIRVWLFDAPSELVSDLKKKLTFDKTSQAFRTQVRSLRAALSMQLREPTLFAGQPLLGKSYNTMINLVADSLNRGEVVLPSSAYLSMMRMEIDKIKADYEAEMRAGIDKLLSDMEAYANSADPNKSVLYPTEVSANKQLLDLFDRVSSKCEVEVQQSIGSVSSALSSQILCDFPQQIERVNSILREQYLVSYRHQFSKWLISARKRAEVKLTSDFGHLSLRKDMPLEDTDVETSVQGILSAAIAVIGGSSVYANNEGVRDAEDILNRHFQQLADKFKAHNTSLKQSMREAVLVHLNDVVAVMKKTVKDSVISLTKSEPRGYGLVKLEQVLNAKYFELKEQLHKKCGPSRYGAEMLSEFKNICGQLRDEMVEDYKNAKQAAFNKVLEGAQKLGESELNKISNVDFDRNIHTDAWLTLRFNDCIVGLIKDLKGSVAGWLSSEDETNESFESDLTDTLQGLAMILSENVLAFWNEIIAEEYEEAAELALAAAKAEAAAAAAAQMAMDEDVPEIPRRHYADEVEEDDDEDVYNKSGRVFQSKLGSSLGKNEQKNRAKQWAESTLNIKTTKRGASSASVAAKKVATPAKSVEQQRADAAAFAAKNFGEAVLNNRSPVRPAAPVVDENVNQNNSSSSSSSASGGLFGNVKSWFGATPESTTPKKETAAGVKKETVSPVPATAAASTGKPLTALQIAKAEMKRAEAERVANMISSKKAKK